jgi:hypothetical protein
MFSHPAGIQQLILPLPRVVSKQPVVVCLLYSLPLQLATLAVQLVMSQRLCVCRMASSKQLQAAIQATCRCAAGFMLRA